MEWKQWKDQGELKRSIKGWIDTGAGRSHICDSVIDDFGDKYARSDIHKAISELKKDMLIVHCGHGNYKVRCFANSSLAIGTGHRNTKQALEKLMKSGVFHEYMVRDGLVSVQDVPEEDKDWIERRYPNIQR